MRENTEMIGLNFRLVCQLVESMRENTEMIGLNFRLVCQLVENMSENTEMIGAKLSTFPPIGGEHE